jgi:hypothetical protein
MHDRASGNNTAIQVTTPRPRQRLARGSLSGEPDEGVLQDDHPSGEVSAEVDRKEDGSRSGERIAADIFRTRTKRA